MQFRDKYGSKPYESAGEEEKAIQRSALSITKELVRLLCPGECDNEFTQGSVDTEQNGERIISFCCMTPAEGECGLPDVTHTARLSIAATKVTTDEGSQVTEVTIRTRENS